MKYNGMINGQVKKQAMAILNEKNEGKITREKCFDALHNIHQEVEKVREPFFKEVDKVLVKYNVQSSLFEMEMAKKELAQISITVDVEAEKIIDKLIEKINQNR